MQISLKTLNVYKDKIDFFINEAICCTMLWPVFDAWIDGNSGMMSYDCITDGETLYAQGYGGNPQIKIGDTIKKKKYIYDYTSHFYKSVNLGISFKIGGLKRRVIERARESCEQKIYNFNKLCCTNNTTDAWGRDFSYINIRLCKKRHKIDNCSGFVFGIHGKYFCESDFLTKEVSKIPYYEDFGKVLHIMNKYPKIVRPE